MTYAIFPPEPCIILFANSSKVSEDTKLDDNVDCMDRYKIK